MSSLVLKATLVLSALLGMLPADHCVLRMAGMCPLRKAAHGQAAKACCGDCCASQDRGGNPATDQHPQCCAPTPADGISLAPTPPVALDLHVELLPAPLAYLPALAAASPDTSFSSIALAPPDIPLYLIERTFLL